LITVFDPFNVLLNLICKCFIVNTFSSVHQGNWCVVFFFCCCALSSLRVILVSYNDFASLPFLSILWNSLRSIGIISSLKEN
jgi:hypothetical protein